MTVPARKAITPQSERKTVNDSSPNRRQSLDPEQQLSRSKKSHSSHSLPDLLAENDDSSNSDGVATKILENSLISENDTAKPLKKRSFFISKFKKKKTQ